VAASVKHSSLRRWGVHCGCKKIYDTGPWGSIRHPNHHQIVFIPSNKSQTQVLSNHVVLADNHCYETSYESSDFFCHYISPTFELTDNEFDQYCKANMNSSTTTVTEHRMNHLIFSFITFHQLSNSPTMNLINIVKQTWTHQRPLLRNICHYISPTLEFADTEFDQYFKININSSTTIVTKHHMNHLIFSVIAFHQLLNSPTLNLINIVKQTWTCQQPLLQNIKWILWFFSSLHFTNFWTHQHWIWSTM